MFTKEFEIPDYETIKNELPLSLYERKTKENNDNSVKAIIEGKDKRKLLIIGPCSIDSEYAALKYLEFLAKISEIHKKNFFIVPRIYTCKSRSLSYSFNGFVSSQDGGKTIDFRNGIYAARKLHIEAIKRFGLSGADEMVYPELTFYFDDIVSYFVIGARCVSDPLHRHIASGLNVPVGLKNNLSGDSDIMINGLKSVIAPNNFIFSGKQYKTSGNPYVHTVLRGINFQDGYKPNISCEDLRQYSDLLRRADVPNSIIADLNHANSGKDADKQFNSVDIMENALKNENIKGFMIESYLFDGKGDGNGYSLTDSCLGIDKTEKLIDYLQEKLQE